MTIELKSVKKIDPIHKPFASFVLLVVKMETRIG